MLSLRGGETLFSQAGHADCAGASSATEKSFATVLIAIAGQRIEHAKVRGLVHAIMKALWADDVDIQDEVLSFEHCCLLPLRPGTAADSGSVLES